MTHGQCIMKKRAGAGKAQDNGRGLVDALRMGPSPPRSIVEQPLGAGSCRLSVSDHGRFKDFLLPDWSV